MDVDEHIGKLGPASGRSGAGSPPCLGPEVDWLPDHLALSAWMEHVPFAFWLVKALRPRVLVELGTHNGVSYAAFCQAVDRLGLATRCYAVDTWTGDEHAGFYGEEVFRAISALNERRWPRFSTLLRTTFDKASEQFAGGEIDLLHIDGLHTYEAVASDFRRWRDRLSASGVVLFHDINERNPGFGVWRFWQEVRAEHPHFEFAHGHGLGVLGVGARLPEAVRALLALPPDGADALRTVFAARGHAVQVLYELQEAEARTAAAERAAEELRLSLAERDRAVAAARRADASARAELRAALDVERGERLRAQGASAAFEHRAAQSEAQVRALTASTSWRLTRPLRAAAGLLRRDPAYRARLRDLASGVTGRPVAAPPAVDAAAARRPPETAATVATVGVEVLRRGRFPDLTPLPRFTVPRGGRRRLSIVTDSVGRDSLFGGVGTALILGALAARRLDAGLRLVTRTEAADIARVGDLLAVQGVPWRGDIETVHAPRGLPAAEGKGVPSQPDEVFLTTSWWTTRATLAATPTARIACLVQEDERTFYPFGDDHLLATETLAHPGLLHTVNSRLLLAHLHAQGLVPGAIAFEPAFPEALYRTAARDASPPPAGRRQFFFYARPRHARNLYWRGLEALCSAIEEGVLEPEDWTFHFVGHSGETVALPRQAQARVAGPMPWADYAAFIGRMDLGLSLMYSPHPSYPPLDLAASGAVVVTNRFAGKTSLEDYSPNILCADLDRDALVRRLAEGAELAADASARAANLARSRFERDWSTALAPVLDRLEAWAEARAATEA